MKRSDNTITCDYCQQNPGTTNGTVWRGFYDADTAQYVCNNCKTTHYQRKWQGPHKGKYSEFPATVAAVAVDKLKSLNV